MPYQYEGMTLEHSAQDYRAACLVEKLVLEEMGHVSRDHLRRILDWHGYACQAVSVAKYALLDTAQGSPIITAPTADGAIPVRIY